MAAVDVHLKWKSGERLRWFETKDGISHPIRSAAKTYLYDPRWPQEPLLVKEGEVDPYYQYPYYLSLRCTTPWRVPVLDCRFPERFSDTRGEDGEFTDDAKVCNGRLAFFLIYLFRPFRNYYDEIIEPASRRIRGPPTQAARWLALYEAFQCWRHDNIDSVANPIFYGGGIDKNQ